jgi:hypothetical protein
MSTASGLELYYPLWLLVRVEPDQSSRLALGGGTNTAARCDANLLARSRHDWTLLPTKRRGEPLSHVFVG